MGCVACAHAAPLSRVDLCAARSLMCRSGGAWRRRASSSATQRRQLRRRRQRSERRATRRRSRPRCEHKCEARLVSERSSNFTHAGPWRGSSMLKQLVLRRAPAERRIARGGRAASQTPTETETHNTQLRRELETHRAPARARVTRAAAGRLATETREARAFILFGWVSSVLLSTIQRLSP